MTYLSISITVMKRSIVIIILLFVYSIAFAQTAEQPGNSIPVRICTPSRSSVLAPPLYIIFKNKKEIYRTSIAIPNIQPQDILSIQILKGNSATEKYGNTANNGVVEIYMKKGANVDANKIKSDTNKIKLKTDTGKAIKYRGGR